MRKGSRDINIFSMSALDLFASTMGVFIVITLILLPFFPNTGDSPVRVAEVRQELEEARRRIDRLEDDLRDASEELERERNAPKLSFPALDLVIALDTTGSMGDQVLGLRNEIRQMAALIMRLAPSVGIGLIDFKDRCEGANAVREAFPLARIDDAALNRLSAATQTFAAGSAPCNTDPPEAIDLALRRAIDSSWRPEAEVRVIALITDNAAYPELESDVLATARRFAASAEQARLSAVFVNSGPNQAYGRDFLRQLAEAGGGEFVDAGGSFTVAILFALAGI